MITTSAKPCPPVVPVKNVNGLDVVGSMPPFTSFLISGLDTTLKTVIFDAPTALMSAAVIVACNCVLEMKVVVRGLPLNLTTDEGTKLLPVTVTVKSAPPRTAELGVSDLMVGGGKAAVKFKEPEMPPAGAGLNTVTDERPTVFMSAEVMAACSVVEETKVVGRAAPLNSTTEVGTKFEPVTVRVNPAAPAATAGGFRLAIEGTGLFTVKPKPAETPPWPIGLAMVIVLFAPAAISAAVIEP